MASKYMLCSVIYIKCTMDLTGVGWFNPFQLRTAKTLWSFGCSKGNRV